MSVVQLAMVIELGESFMRIFWQFIVRLMCVRAESFFYYLYLNRAEPLRYKTYCNLFVAGLIWKFVEQLNFANSRHIRKEQLTENCSTCKNRSKTWSEILLEFCFQEILRICLVKNCPGRSSNSTLYIYIFYIEMKVRIFRVITYSQKCDFQLRHKNFFQVRRDLYKSGVKCMKIFFVSCAN